MIVVFARGRRCLGVAARLGRFATASPGPGRPDVFLTRGTLYYGSHRPEVSTAVARVRYYVRHRRGGLWASSWTAASPNTE